MIVRAADRVLVMGITGKQGTFWTERMQAYGTRVVGGTNPQKAGATHCNVPVFATARDAMGGRRSTSRSSSSRRSWSRKPPSTRSRRARRDWWC
jgi:succinyl-CoA synthetase alpha subunit